MATLKARVRVIEGIRLIWPNTGCRDVSGSKCGSAKEISCS
jgi:hypothetical protein